jgi:hypothetical protein
MNLRIKWYNAAGCESPTVATIMMETIYTSHVQIETVPFERKHPFCTRDAAHLTRPLSCLTHFNSGYE